MSSYTAKDSMPALKPTGLIAVDFGGQGITGSPSYVEVAATDGTKYYLFVETDGTVKVHNAVPTQDSDGTVVGTQT